MANVRIFTTGQEIQDVPNVTDVAWVAESAGLSVDGDFRISRNNSMIDATPTTAVQDWDLVMYTPKKNKTITGA